MRKLLLNVHLCAGLAAAIALLLLGVTGCLLVFENSLDRSLNPKLYYVQPQGNPLPLASVAQSIQAQYPEYRLFAFGFPSRNDLALAVALRSESLKKDLSLSVNPYTGQVLGDRGQGNSFMEKVHGFHTRLLLGVVGKNVMGWSSVFLLLLSISGIILWWPRKRFRITAVESPQLFNFNLHNTLGICSSIVLAIFAVTGMSIHWEGPVAAFANKVSNAAAPSPLRPKPAPAGALPLSPDQLRLLAEQALPGASATNMSLGVRANGPVQITLKFPEDHTPAGRSRVLLDAYSGQVLSLQNSRTMTVPQKYAQMWNREIHTGDLWGWPTRLLAFICSLILPVLAITGPLIWLFCKRSRAQNLRASSAAT
jgi:uncharacterized iron-regulated membrane protein